MKGETFSYLPDYYPLSIKGSGSFGHVFKAYDRNHNCLVALKMTHKVGPKLSREFDILTQLKDCDYVVKLLDAYYTLSDEKKLIQNLVFEYLPNNLDKYMRKIKRDKSFINIKKIKEISKQLLLGLSYCHKKDIVHRDLKPENILLTDDEQVKICDFGSAKIIPKASSNDNEMKDIYDDYKIVNVKSTPFTVSRYYRAPELFFGKCDYDSKIDIFSMGLIIGELFTLETLFMGKNEGLQIFEYINVLGMVNFDYLDQFDIPQSFKQYLKEYKIDKFYTLKEILNKDKHYSQKDMNDACDLLNNMLKWDYNERFSAEQCLKHKFFSELDNSLKISQENEICFLNNKKNV